MAEDVSYWVCKCGVANHMVDKTCKSCSRKRPVRRRYWVFSGLAIVVVVGLIVGTEHSQKQSTINPAAQVEFLTENRKFNTQWREAANLIAQQQILRSKYQALTKHVDAKDWAGKVTGINTMQGKGALTVDVGGETLVAGDDIARNLSTLIDLNSTHLKEKLLSLKLGDLITLSGHFVVDQGEMVDLGNGNYLFQFDDVETVAK